MSLILDALNKADRERQNHDSPPGINANHDIYPHRTKSRAWTEPAIVTAMIVAVMLATGAYFVGKSSTTAPAELSTPIREPIADELPTGSVANKSVVASAKQTAEVRALLQKKRIEAQYKQIQELKAKAIKSNGSSANAATTQADEKPDAVSSLYKKENTSKSSSNSSSRNAVKTEAVKKEIDKEVVKPDSDVIGSIRDLPWTMQTEIPTLMYSEHHFNNTPDDYVRINNQRAKIGQKISGILLVESISEDGVILSYQSHKFKMPALSSWINM